MRGTKGNKVTNIFDWNVTVYIEIPKAKLKQKNPFLIGAKFEFTDEVRFKTKTENFFKRKA